MSCIGAFFLVPETGASCLDAWYLRQSISTVDLGFCPSFQVRVFVAERPFSFLVVSMI
jgi:hypothetical protein